VLICNIPVPFYRQCPPDSSCSWATTAVHNMSLRKLERLRLGSQSLPIMSKRTRLRTGEEAKGGNIGLSELWPSRKPSEHAKSRSRWSVLLYRYQKCLNQWYIFWRHCTYDIVWKSLSGALASLVPSCSDTFGRAVQSPYLLTNIAYLPHKRRLPPGSPSRAISEGARL